MKWVKKYGNVAALMMLSGAIGAGLQMTLAGKLNIVWDKIERFQTLLASLVVVVGGGIVIGLLRSQLQKQTEESRANAARKELASVLYGEWEANIKFYRAWLGPSLDRDTAVIDVKNLPDTRPPGFSFEISKGRELGILGPHFNESQNVVRKFYDVHWDAASNGAMSFGSANPVLIYYRLSAIVLGLEICAETGEFAEINWQWPGRSLGLP